MTGWDTDDRSKFGLLIDLLADLRMIRYWLLMLRVFVEVS